MEEYKVKEEDLKGQLKSFPIEVVQKMIERQVEQRNPADVTVFQKNKCLGSVFKGFEWVETDEGIDFWNNVIRYENFHVFFEKYPKNETSETEDTSKVEEPKSKVDTHVYYRGVAGSGKEIINILKNIGGRSGRFDCYNENFYYFINPRNNTIEGCEIGQDYSYLLKECYTEKFLPEVKPEVKSETIQIDGKKYNKQEILDRIKELKEVKQ